MIGIFLVKIRRQETGSSFEKPNSDEKQRNEAITRKRWGEGRCLRRRSLCDQQKVGRGREGKRRRHKGNMCREGVMGRGGRGWTQTQEDLSADEGMARQRHSHVIASMSQGR